MKQGWLLASLVAIVFALGIGFVFILPRVRMLRAVLPEWDTRFRKLRAGVFKIP